MKEFSFSATIKLNENRLRFIEPIKFDLSSSEKFILFTPESDEIINIGGELVAGSLDEFKSTVLLQLSKLRDILSWFYDIPIGNIIINSVSYSTKNKGDDKAIDTVEKYFTTDGIIISRILGDELASVLKEKFLSKMQLNEEEVLFMWCQAISEESIGLRYLLFYRILEKVIGEDKITNWIRKVEPQVESKNDRSRGDMTIYTFLRDNVHPKQKEFPFEKIADYLPRLKNLVRMAIEEKYKILCSPNPIL